MSARADCRGTRRLRVISPGDSFDLLAHQCASQRVLHYRDPVFCHAPLRAQRPPPPPPWGERWGKWKGSRPGPPCSSRRQPLSNPSRRSHQRKSRHDPRPIYNPLHNPTRVVCACVRTRKSAPASPLLSVVQEPDGANLPAYQTLDGEEG